MRFGFVALRLIGLALTAPARDPADWAQWRATNPQAAEAWLESPAGPGAGNDTRAAAKFLYEATVYLEDRGEYQMELEVAGLALSASQRADDPELTAKAKYAIALGHWGVGNLPAAVSVYTEVLEWFTDSQDWAMAGRAASNLGGVFHDSGELDLAVEFYQRGIDYLRRADSPPRQLGDALGNLALLWFHLGDIDKADRIEHEALNLRRQHQDIRGVAISLNNLGDRAIREGRNEEAAVFLDESFALIQSLDDKSMLAGALTLQAQLPATTSRPPAPNWPPRGKYIRRPDRRWKKRFPRLVRRSPRPRFRLRKVGPGDFGNPPPYPQGRRTQRDLG